MSKKRKVISLIFFILSWLRCAHLGPVGCAFLPVFFLRSQKVSLLDLQALSLNIIFLLASNFYHKKNVFVRIPLTFLCFARKETSASSCIRYYPTCVFLDSLEK